MKRNINALLFVLIFTSYAKSASAEVGLTQGLLSHLDWIQGRVSGDAKCAKGLPLSFKEKNGLARLCMTQICGLANEVSSTEELEDSLIRDFESHPKFIEKTKEASRRL